MKYIPHRVISKMFNKVIQIKKNTKGTGEICDFLE